MVHSLRHRGPDANAQRILSTDRPETRVGLGHARLSILDLSDAGLQPMTDPSGGLTVIHNGEIYNYLELRDELGGAGRFRTRTDTEVLLAAYERWGEACVDHFNGMFAFALWDARRQRLFCARDRLGIKPFHYTWSAGCFIFASEVRALFAAGVHAEADVSTWADYLVHGVYDHDERTFFENVHSLPPGEVLALEGPQVGAPEPGSCTRRRYWSLSDVADSPLGDEQNAIKTLEELLADAVRIRLRSDVTVGVNLSGGLDSSALMTTIDDLVGSGAQVETFTAGFDDPRYDETEFADAVPHQAAWVRNLERVGEEKCRGLLEEVARHQSAPFGGVATIAYHALHGKARERGVTVLLEGQGVDELLGGYAYFRPLRYLDLIEGGAEREAAIEADLFGDDLQASVALARAELEGAPTPYQDGSWHLRPGCIHPDLVALAGPRPTFERPFGSHLLNGLHRDLRHTKLPRVLRMNDRLSMAFGRELREPFLDHRLVEFAFRLPGHLKIGGGQAKVLLRRLLSKRQVPSGVHTASKRAVVTPQREWLRGPWSAIVRDALASAALRDRGWVLPEVATGEFERFLAGEGDNAFFLWQWIMVSHEASFR